MSTKFFVYPFRPGGDDGSGEPGPGGGALGAAPGAAAGLLSRDGRRRERGSSPGVSLKFQDSFLFFLGVLGGCGTDVLLLLFELGRDFLDKLVTVVIEISAVEFDLAVVDDPYLTPFNVLADG